MPDKSAINTAIIFSNLTFILPACLFVQPNSLAVGQMWKYTSFDFVTFVVAVAFSGPVNAATAAKKVAKPAPSKEQILATQLIINSPMPPESFVQACSRGNFSHLALALNMNETTIQPTKGEYESTDSFTTRLAQVRDFMEKEPKFVCLSLSNHNEVDFQYIADNQHFLASFPSNIAVLSSVRFLKNYRSTTAFGVAATVRATLESQYRLDLLTQDLKSTCLDIYPVDGSYKIFFTVPASLADAPRIKTNGKMVVAFTLTSPFVSESFKQGEPTLDDPLDASIHALTVTAAPSAIHVIDAGGKVVWSCSFTS